MTELDPTEPDAAPALSDAEQARTEELRLGPFMTQPHGSSVAPTPQAVGQQAEPKEPQREAKAVPATAGAASPPGKKVDAWAFGAHELPMALSAELIGAKVPVIPEADMYRSPQVPQAARATTSHGAGPDALESRRARVRRWAAFSLLFCVLLVAAAGASRLLRSPGASTLTPPASNAESGAEAARAIEPAAIPVSAPSSAPGAPMTTVGLAPPASAVAGTAKPVEGQDRKRPRKSKPAVIAAPALESAAPVPKPPARPFDRIPPPPPE